MQVQEERVRTYSLNFGLRQQCQPWQHHATMHKQLSSLLSEVDERVLSTDMKTLLNQNITLKDVLSIRNKIVKDSLVILMKFYKIEFKFGTSNRVASLVSFGVNFKILLLRKDHILLQKVFKFVEKKKERWPMCYGKVCLVTT